MKGNVATIFTETGNFKMVISRPGKVMEKT